MKKALISLSTLLLIASSVTFLSAQPKHTISNITESNQSTIFDYTITHIDNNEYYGSSMVDDTQIYFTSDDITPNTTININDTVNAHFEPDNTVDGLIKIEKN